MSAVSLGGPGAAPVRILFHSASSDERTQPKIEQCFAVPFSGE